jgi:hypothetical protein
MRPLAHLTAIVALSMIGGPTALHAQRSPSFTATFHFGAQTIGPAPVLELGGTTESKLRPEQHTLEANATGGPASAPTSPTNELVLTYAADAPALAQLRSHALRPGQPPSLNAVGTLEIVTEGGSGSRPLRMSATQATIVQIASAQLQGKNVTKVVVRYDKLTRN